MSRLFKLSVILEDNKYNIYNILYCPGCFGCLLFFEDNKNNIYNVLCCLSCFHLTKIKVLLGNRYGKMAVKLIFAIFAQQK